MSPLDRPVPPAGEEIHLPGGSLQPLALTVGLTMVLLGVTISNILLIGGIVVSVVTIALWIRDAKREFDHLPSEHDAH